MLRRRGCGGRGRRWRRWQRLAFRDDGDLVEVDGREGLVVGIALDAGDGHDNKDAGWVALTKDGVVLVKRGGRLFGDEELTTVGVGAGVGHGEAARDIEVEVGVELIGEGVAGIAHAGAGGVAALNHEFGNDAVEGGAVVEGLVVLLLVGDGVGPVFGALGESDEVGDGVWGLLLEELAGDAAHGSVHDDVGAVGLHQCGGGGRGRVGDFVGGLGGVLCERCRGESEAECGNDECVLDVHANFEGTTGRTRLVNA